MPMMLYMMCSQILPANPPPACYSTVSYMTGAHILNDELFSIDKGENLIFRGHNHASTDPNCSRLSCQVGDLELVLIARKAWVAI